MADNSRGTKFSYKYKLVISQMMFPLKNKFFVSIQLLSILFVGVAQLAERSAWDRKAVRAALTTCTIENVCARPPAMSCILTSLVHGH